MVTERTGRPSRNSTPSTRTLPSTRSVSVFNRTSMLRRRNSRSVSTNWRLDRMAKVDRNVLRLAVYELLWTRPGAPASILEVDEYDRLTKQILVKPPRVPLEEGAIEIRYAQLAPEAKAMFEWAHILHRQLYDILAEEGEDLRGLVFVQAMLGLVTVAAAGTVLAWMSPTAASPPVNGSARTTRSRHATWSSWRAARPPSRRHSSSGPWSSPTGSTGSAIC